MIELLPLRDRGILSRLNEEAGESCAFAYCLYDGGKVTGYLLYDVDLTKGEAVLRAVRAPDEPSFDGLVRAVFSSLREVRIRAARFGEAVDRGPLERLGFVKPGEWEAPPLDVFFQSGGHCGKN